jgi:iron complex transport system permease protein
MTETVIGAPVEVGMAWRRWPLWLIVPAAGLAASILGALAIGKFAIIPAEIPRFLLASLGCAEMAPSRYAALTNVLIDIRLPRILAAVLVGSALASSGAAFQAVFRNPLVSPGLLGVLAGASFGAALGIVLNLPWAGVQTAAFLMGLVAVAVGVGTARLFGGAPMIMMVLGGMIGATLFGALLSVVKYIADPMNQLPSIVYWLMGDLAQSNLRRVAWLTGPMLAGTAVLIAFGRALDALAMGEDEARCLGVPVAAVRYAVVAAATLVSAATVSMAGMIGWIGLLVPHVVRLILGASNTRLIPASALGGAIFLIWADVLARSIADVEIPIGLLTEILGIPVFLAVLGRASRGWHE